MGPTVGVGWGWGGAGGQKGALHPAWMVLESARGFIVTLKISF